ncbi:MAG: serine hydrolase domain-containing protein [Candidatus Krumholzibacteriia bacterium]
MKKLLAVIVLAHLAGAVPAAAGSLETRLQAVLETFAAANPSAPGVVAWAVCPGQGLDWAGAVGSANPETGESLTTTHTFRIASNTKTYLAAAVLLLAEQGRLGLDDPLARHLTGERRSQLAADGYDPEAMTIAQVLAHTSGLFEHPADPRYAEAIMADPHHRWTPDEQVARCIEWGDPVGEPGEEFSYSDTGYVLLGEIVARYAGTELGPAVRSLVGFERLGLDSTWWEIMEPVPAGAGPRAHQFYGEFDTYDWDPSLDLYGGGGLVCDVGDLGLFIRRLLKGGVLGRESSLAAMTGRGTAGYRLGLICTSLADRQAWGHSGFWNTFAYHVPSLDLTVAGCVLDHFAERGQVLADRLVAAVADADR